MKLVLETDQKNKIDIPAIIHAAIVQDIYCPPDLLKLIDEFIIIPKCKKYCLKVSLAERYLNRYICLYCLLSIINSNLQNKWKQYNIKRGDIVNIDMVLLKCESYEKSNKIVIFDGINLIDLWDIDSIAYPVIPRQFDPIVTFSITYWDNIDSKTSNLYPVMMPYLKEYKQQIIKNKKDPIIWQYSCHGRNCEYIQYVEWSYFIVNNGITIIYTSYGNDNQYQDLLQLLDEDFCYTDNIKCSYRDVEKFIEECTFVDYNYHIYLHQVDY